MRDRPGFVYHGRRSASDRLRGRGDTCGGNFDMTPGRASGEGFHAFHTTGKSRVGPDFELPAIGESDEVAAQVLEPPGRRHHVPGPEVVAHDLEPEVPAGSHHDLDGLRVGALHDDDVRGPGPGHHLRFEPAAVHGFEVRDNGHARERGPQRPHAVHALGDDESGWTRADVAWSGMPGALLLAE